MHVAHATRACALRMRVWPVPVPVPHVAVSHSEVGMIFPAVNPSIFCWTTMIHSWALSCNASMSNLKSFWWPCLRLQFSLLLLFISWILKQSCVSINSAYPCKNIQVFAFFSNYLTLVWFTFSLETGEYSFFLLLLQSFSSNERFWASVFAANANSFTSSNFNTISLLTICMNSWLEQRPDQHTNFLFVAVGCSS